MTLVLAAHSREGIWLLADRRLSRNGKPVRDDACKVLVLEGTDGSAILGYAGLGATKLGTEPSAWMSTVLRGRGKLTIEAYLGLLAQALRDQLPKHLTSLRGPGHFVIAPALVDDQPRLYRIGVRNGPGRGQLSVGYQRCFMGVRDGTGPAAPPRFALAGSGTPYLMARQSEWSRPLMRLLRRTDRGRSPPALVSNYLAQLNHSVHEGVRDGSVGPRCIVVNRFRSGGGGPRYYTGTDRDPSPRILPMVGNGTDLGQFLQVLWDAWLEDTLHGGHLDLEAHDAKVDAEMRKMNWEPKWELE